MYVEDNVGGFAGHLISGLSRIESNEKIWFYLVTPTKIELPRSRLVYFFF